MKCTYSVYKNLQIAFLGLLLYRLPRSPGAEGHSLRGVSISPLVHHTGMRQGGRYPLETERIRGLRFQKALSPKKGHL